MWRVNHFQKSQDFKHDAQGKVFDSNCVEMGVEAIEMDYEDGEHQNNMKLEPTEKSWEKLFTSGRPVRVCILLKHDVKGTFF